MENSKGIRKVVDFALWAMLIVLIFKWYHRLTNKTRERITGFVAIFMLLVFASVMILSIVEKTKMKQIVELRERDEKKIFDGKTKDEYITDYQNSSEYLCKIAINDVKYLHGEKVMNEDDPNHQEYVTAVENCNTVLNKGALVYHKDDFSGWILFKDIVAFTFTLILTFWMWIYIHGKNVRKGRWEPFFPWEKDIVVIHPDSSYLPSHPEDQLHESQTRN